MPSGGQGIAIGGHGTCGLVVVGVGVGVVISVEVVVVGKLTHAVCGSEMTSTAFLLLICLRGFYVGNSRFMTAFYVSFLVVMGIAATIPLTVVGERVSAASPFCTMSQKTPVILQVLSIIPLANNAAIFTAIAMKLMPLKEEEAHERARIVRFRRLLWGNHLPDLSRTFWWDLQRYILYVYSEVL